MKSLIDYIYWLGIGVDTMLALFVLDHWGRISESLLCLRRERIRQTKARTIRLAVC